jgi:hypothetical protein
MDEDGTRPGTARSDAGQTASLADNPWVVLAFLLFVTLALGIPLIWISRAFSRPIKLLLTVLVTVYTALILWLFWLVMAACYHRIMNAL